MIASLLSRLDPELCGFKDQIIASETLPTVANAYSQLSRSSLGQPSIASTSPSTGLESSALVSNSGFRGGGHGVAHVVAVEVVVSMVDLVVVVVQVSVVIENVIMVVAPIILSHIVGKSMASLIMHIRSPKALHRPNLNHQFLLIRWLLFLVLMMHSA